MSWENFKPTKAERNIIENGWNILEKLTGYNHQNEPMLKLQKNGCGYKNSKIPLVAAKGLCVKSFYNGIKNPDCKLYDMYFTTVPNIWFTGLGTEKAYKISAENESDIKFVVNTYENVFKRMIDQNT